MKALSEMISFCDGRGPSDQIDKSKRMTMFNVRHNFLNFPLTSDTLAENILFKNPSTS